MLVKSLIIEEHNRLFITRVHSKTALASELLTKSLTCFYCFYFSGNILYIPYSTELTTGSTLLEGGLALPLEIIH
jgi:hypothetical protein